MRTRAEIDSAYAESIAKMRLLAAEGYTAREMAERLGIKHHTAHNRAAHEGIVYRRERRGRDIEHVVARPCKCHPVTARGHVYGPKLLCKCGATWDAQQAEPTRCVLAGKRGTG